jgi:hypothetical protein
MAEASGLTQVMAQAEREWDNQALHAAILELCSEPSELASVAKWYRRHTAIPERAEVAEAQLRRVTARAVTHLESHRSNRRPEASGRLGKYLLIAIFLVGAAILATYL